MKNGNLNHIAKNPHGWDWHYPRSRVKLGIHVVLAIFLVLMFALIVVMLYLLFSGSEKSDICTTPTCVRTSMELLQYVNPKADPCEDFYLFSCGNFLENTHLDNVGSKSVSGTVEDEIQTKIRHMLELPVQNEEREAFKKAKKFYKACMNETQVEINGLKGMRMIFREIGGWPTVRGKLWNEDNFDWKNATHSLRRLGVNTDFFFKVTLDRNRKNKREYILGIHGDLYSPSKINKTTRKLYLEYMVRIAEIFGANNDTAIRDSNAVIDLLLKLAQTYEDSKFRNKTGQFDVYNLSELQNRFPKINWKSYLDGVLGPIESVRNDENIVVSEPLYLAAVIDILTTTSNRTLSNFISWFTLQHLINYLPSKVLDRAYEFLGEVNRKDLKVPRWTTCIKATQERMDSVVSAAFIDHYFDGNSSKDVEEMMRNIKTQFIANLRRLDWLDDKSRALVTERLLSSVEDIGSYSDLAEIHFENSAYDDVQVYEDKLLESVLNLDFVTMNMHISKLRKPIRENWLGKSSFVTSIYVYYSSTENIIRFPAGLFGGFYYQLDRPKYVNYGVVGTIMAHELSHVMMKAKDPELQGELRSLWSMDSLVRYGEEAKCLKDRYGAFEVGELNMRLNAEKTEDEDVADLAGAKISYDTYFHWVQDHGREPLLPGIKYSPFQLFWISSAIRHCSKYSPAVLKRYHDNYQWSPPQFRVNGPLQNLDAFVMDFGCPAGSRMNPEKKCSIW